MNKTHKVIMLIFTLMLVANTVWAITLVSPKEGQIVYQGDKLTVIVKPDPGESWEEVEIDLAPMSYSFITKQYTADIQIRKDKLGFIRFSVRAYDKAGNETELKRSLFVKLPPDVVLQSIEVNPSFILLEKMPAGSAPDDVSAYSTKKLRVNGIYSDAVKRKLSSSAAGTTYVSGNDKVATVDTEGLITAQDIGETTITVRNGKYSATVKVVVKPYKP